VQEGADRVAILSLGRKVLEGSLDELLTEKQATLVSVPGELTDARRADLERVLAQAGFSGADVRFSRPRLSLEQLYLRTVKDPGP
jgi:ABC-type multidrug transport system ATPase subunit